MTTSTATKRLVVAINPTASFGKGREVGPAAVAELRRLGHEVVSLSESDFPSLVDAATRALADGPDALVVVGGDGMVNLGVNLVAETATPLGIIPSGTGNDMARGLGIPIGDTAEAVRVVERALTREPRVIDAGRVTSAAGVRWFACVLSAGFDSVVTERANRMRRPRGRARYTIALLLELARLRPVVYRITVDGVEMQERALLACVGNNVSFGGGMRVTPDAVLDDGLLDALVVRPLSRIQFLRIFPRVFRGEHITDPRVSIVRGRRIGIEADGMVAYGDGERFGPLPVDIECVPGALRVLA
ncbi:diacylglycerol/lipid kinase family protein [Lysobacter korlensis]|uniref:Diacylglycerol/lipid kinase family protein n=1 Tax=Lysobacter korlensis TaxID=553636 RepID=A0ABV6RXL5_9GAMM